jgi:predicted permease
MHFYEELVRRLAARPGISSVGVGTDLPWTGYNENSGFSIDGKKPPPHSGFHARYHAASDGYFRTLGIPLVQGRFFNGHDGGKGAMKTVIVNQAMARRYWPNEQVIGQRITFDDNPKPEDWLTIVGLVGDVKDTPASDGAEPAFWWPLRDVPFRDTTVVVRGSSAPNILAEEIRRVVKELDPMLAVADEQGMDEIVGRAYSPARFALSLIGLFASMALILAVVGTYGVISYSMNQRRREFGLRIALGAQPADVLRFVFARGMRLALTGVALGIGSSLVFGRLLTGLLYQVTPHDLTSIGGASLTVILSAALATYIPAHRATRSDPMRALRAE